MSAIKARAEYSALLSQVF